MDKLKTLEMKKLFKELDFLETDYMWTNEIVNEADSSFMDSINSFLEKHPDLKDLYDKKITEKINQTIDNVHTVSNEITEEDGEFKKEDVTEDESEQEQIVTEKSPKIKKIYREIVKLTHPDVVGKESKLNELYIEATKHYDNNDLVGLYKICSQLEIGFNMEDGDQGHILVKIEEYKSKISFLESTYTWKWFNTKDDTEKDRILISFIKMKLGS